MAPTNSISSAPSAPPVTRSTPRPISRFGGWAVAALLLVGSASAANPDPTAWLAPPEPGLLRKTPPVCSELEDARQVPVPPERRAAAVARLSQNPAVPLTPAEAAALLPQTLITAPAAVKAAAVAELRARADQLDTQSRIAMMGGAPPVVAELARLRQAADALAAPAVSLKPYLVRGVGRGAADEVHACVGEGLVIIVHAGPPTASPEWRPVVVYLTHPPGRIYIDEILAP